MQRNSIDDRAPRHGLAFSAPLLALELDEDVVGPKRGPISRNQKRSTDLDTLHASHLCGPSVYARASPLSWRHRIFRLGLSWSTLHPTNLEVRRTLDTKVYIDGVCLLEHSFSTKGIITKRRPA